MSSYGLIDDCWWNETEDPAPSEIEGMGVETKYVTHDIIGGHEIKKELVEDEVPLYEPIEMDNLLGEEAAICIEIYNGYAQIYTNQGAENLIEADSFEKIIGIFLYPKKKRARRPLRKKTLSQ